MSLKNKYNDLEIYISTMVPQIDILCFTETFIKTSDLNCIEINNYRLACHYSRGQTSRGGACIFVKSTLEFKKLDWLNDIAVDKVFECCGIVLIDISLTIICIYRPPNSDINTFFQKLDQVLFKTLRQSRKINKKVVLVGDFNINIQELSKNTRLFISLLTSYNMKCTINEPTRITSKSSTCIDNIITNIKKYYVKVLNNGISDHTGQTISLPCKPNFTCKYWYEYRRNIDNNLDIFNKYISQISFTNVYEQKDVNSAYDAFLEIFKLVYDLCFPLERVKMTSKLKPNWVTKGIKISSISKRRLHKKLQVNRNDNNIIEYKRYKTKLKRIITCSKRQSNLKYIKKSTNKAKAVWGLIRLHTSQKRKFKESIQCLKDNNNEITTPQEIVNFLNSHFISQNVNDYNPNLIQREYLLSCDPIISSLFLKPTDECEVVGCVKALKNKKSSGYDDVTMQVVKSCIKTIATHLVFIINMMLETGCFPDSLKITLIKPLHKKGPKNLADNYRPIALLPAFSKIFEKILYSRILDFFNKHNVLQNNQYGFRKNLSTSMAIYRFLQEVWQAVDKKRHCAALFIDMTRAFDCVVHPILITQLEKIGIRGISLKLIESYLNNRLQKINLTFLDKHTKTLQNVESGLQTILMGVPQGSILGPLLFLVYINQLPKVTKHLCVMFADDASFLFIKDKDTCFEEYKSDIKMTLNNLILYLKSLNLTVNLHKTNILQIRNYKKEQLKLNIEHNKTVINEIERTEFLGIILDTHLNWKFHVEKVNNKINSYCYALSVLVDVSSIEVALNAYYANVYSLLSYGIIFWGNSVNVNSTFLLQKRCIRIIFRKQNDESVRNTFREKRLLTLPSLYILEMCKFVRNQMSLFPKISDTRIRQAPLRRFDALQLPRINSMMFEKSTYVSAIRVYNRLPIELKCHPDYKFTRILKEWLISKAFYNINEYYDINN